jgi:hypothetical protein
MASAMPRAVTAATRLADLLVSRPDGNRRNRKTVIRLSDRGFSTSVAHATSRPVKSSGSPVSAASPTTCVRPVTAVRVPPTTNSQPRPLSGRFETINAPTSENASGMLVSSARIVHGSVVLAVAHRSIVATTTIAVAPTMNHPAAAAARGFTVPPPLRSDVRLERS